MLEKHSDYCLCILAAWLEYEESLRQYGLRLGSVIPDLIDEIWKVRPDFPDTIINSYPLKYAGKLFLKKIQEGFADRHVISIHTNRALC